MAGTTPVLSVRSSLFVLRMCHFEHVLTVQLTVDFPASSGMSYEHIDACKNDCALFWKENENLNKCPVCEAPRYKDTHAQGKMIPHKVLHYFLLTPRLRRLYMSG